LTVKKKERKQTKPNETKPNQDQSCQPAQLNFQSLVGVPLQDRHLNYIK